ncbi:hypothetical protein B602_0616 [Chlamydia psittaci M56]|nr:hypothetical protein B602_0616 [Chlamydia psittaci M56]
MKKNVLEIFIKNLQAHNFSSADCNINSSSCEYQLHRQGNHGKGVIYEIIEPNILNCVA